MFQTYQVSQLKKPFPDATDEQVFESLQRERQHSTEDELLTVEAYQEAEAAYSKPLSVLQAWEREIHAVCSSFDDFLDLYVDRYLSN